MRRVVALVLVVFAAVGVVAQQNRIDAVTPSAPELASYGTHDIGVRTIQVTDKNRPDDLNIKEGGPAARYDRTLALEVWYPAALAAGQQPGGEYRAITRDPSLTVTLHGKAVRDAAPKAGEGGFPLVIISHGFPGNRGAANPDYRKTMDARIKAAIAIGPWGMQGGFWDAEGLLGTWTPVLFVAGSVDDVSGYEKGTRAIYQGAVNADRYLLTFINANHNAAAPIPAPAETYKTSGTPLSSPFSHYADPVWDTARMNNILDHFASAYFALYLKGE